MTPTNDTAFYKVWGVSEMVVFPEGRKPAWGQDEKFRQVLISVCFGVESGPESQERPFSAQ